MLTWTVSVSRSTLSWRQFWQNSVSKTANWATGQSQAMIIKKKKKKKKRLLLPFIAALVHRLLCACTGTGTGSNVCTGARTGRVRGDFKEMERHLQELYFQHVLVQLYDLTRAKMFPLAKLFISNPNITILTIASFGSACVFQDEVNQIVTSNVRLRQVRST